VPAQAGAQSTAALAGTFLCFAVFGLFAGLAGRFLAGYAGISTPVLGVGIALEHLSARVTLLGFGVAVGLGLLAAAPTLTGRGRG
jgi:ribose/xylose/arabinose/galactoside ABC-type transport system permease subunit